MPPTKPVDTASPPAASPASASPPGLSPTAVAEAAGAQEVPVATATGEARVLVEPGLRIDREDPEGREGRDGPRITRALSPPATARGERVEVLSPVLLNGTLRGVDEVVEVDGRTFDELSAAGVVRRA